MAIRISQPFLSNEFIYWRCILTPWTTSNHSSRTNWEPQPCPSIRKVICGSLQLINPFTKLCSIHKNKISTRYILAMCKQQTSENLESVHAKGRLLDKEFNLKTITAKENQKEAIRDAFVTDNQPMPFRQFLAWPAKRLLRTHDVPVTIAIYIWFFWIGRDQIIRSKRTGPLQPIIWALSSISSVDLVDMQDHCLASDAVCKGCGKGHYHVYWSSRTTIISNSRSDTWKDHSECSPHYHQRSTKGSNGHAEFLRQHQGVHCKVTQLTRNMVSQNFHSWNMSGEFH